MTGDYIMRVFYDILFFRLRANPKFSASLNLIEKVKPKKV